MKQKIAPVPIYAPFERVERTDDGAVIVSGYCFVNEVIPGERGPNGNGVRLKRSAMEAATADYMQWANVREMHGKNAAGVALSAEWDETGCLLTTKIVDPVAALKCIEGVYKGYSVGVQPLVMRGIDVDLCKWNETSLVDRPKDPGTAITVCRAEGADPEGSYCLVFPAKEETADADSTGPDDAPDTQLVDGAVPPVERALELDEARALEVAAIPDTKSAEEAGGPPAEAPEVERGQASDDVPVRENLEGKAKNLCPACGQLCRSCHEERVDDTATLERLDTLTNENHTLLERVETGLAEIARVQGLLDARDVELAEAKEQIERLENLPAPAPRPVQYTGGVTREFLVNRMDAGQKARLERVSALEVELNRLAESRPQTTEQQMQTVAQINALRQEILALG